MRLPVFPPLSTKDGTANKNARLTNCLKESKKTGDKAVIRPGLVASDTYSGAGNGLIPFDGRLLLIYDDTVYDDTLDTYPWPLDSDPWDAGTTYSFGDTVYYGDILFFSQGNGNIGNTPGTSSYWAKAATDAYNPDRSYDIGERATSDGITYYSYVNGNLGNAPSGDSDVWSPTPPTSLRITATGGGADATGDNNGGTWVDGVGYSASGASRDACAWMILDQLKYTTQPGRSPFGVWCTGPWTHQGSFGGIGSVVTSYLTGWSGGSGTPVETPLGYAISMTRTA